jgi:hypothetical protein
MLILFGKFDKMLKNCTDEAKRKDIGKIGAIEVYKLLGECFTSLKSSGVLDLKGADSSLNELWVDGELVYKKK